MGWVHTAIGGSVLSGLQVPATHKPEGPLSEEPFFFSACAQTEIERRGAFEQAGYSAALFTGTSFNMMLNALFSPMASDGDASWNRSSCSWPAPLAIRGHLICRLLVLPL